MIEDIKKEVDELTKFNGGHNRIYVSDLFQILDKYKDQDKYRKAWEDLKSDFLYEDEQIIKDLEQKYNLGE